MRDEDHGGVERLQLALEPLEAGDVEVVRRLVEEEQVGVAAERARERRARQLAARERAQRPVEVVVGEAEPAEDGGRTVAPAVAAGVLEARLRGRVAVQRRLVVDAAGHRLLEGAQLALDRDEVARAREDVLAQRQGPLERRPLVVERDPGALLEGELAAVLLGLAGEDPEQRRLPGAVRPGERDAVAPLDAERDAVEKERSGELLPEVGGDHDGHDAPRVVRRISFRPWRTPSSSSARSTPSGRCRWTPSSRRTRAIRAPRWRSRRSPTSSTREVMEHNPANPHWPDRDRFVLSAGPRLHPPVRGAPPLGLQPLARGAEALPAVGIAHARAIRRCTTRRASRRRRGRSARDSRTASASGSPSGSSPSATTARTTRSSTTASTSSAPTAT